MSKSKLFVSFTGLMYKMVSGSVSHEDLSQGLFYFGCTREHAISPGANGEYVEHAVTTHPEVHAQLVQTVLAAEAEGRVAWRSKEQRNGRYEQLGELLGRNGHDVASMGRLLDCAGDRQYEFGYSYPGARDLVEDLGLELEVVF